MSNPVNVNPDALLGILFPFAASGSAAPARAAASFSCIPTSGSPAGSVPVARTSPGSGGISPVCNRVDAECPAARSWLSSPCLACCEVCPFPAGDKLFHRHTPSHSIGSPIPIKPAQGFSFSRALRCPALTAVHAALVSSSSTRLSAIALRLIRKCTHSTSSRSRWMHAAIGSIAARTSCPLTQCGSEQTKQGLIASVFRPTA